MNIALILASGKGSRLQNSSVPKQFIKVNDKPLIVYTIEVFNSNQNIDRIVVVTSKEYFDEVRGYISTFNLDKVSDVVIGGETRQLSVYNGLKSIKSFAKDDDNILIHDGARCNVSNTIINKNIESLKDFKAVSTAIKVSDTIFKSENNDTLSNIVNREELYSIQTPQSFKFNLIYNAHESTKDINFTDDAGLVKSFGIDVHVVEGDKNNIKITYDEDLDYFKFLLSK